MENLCSKCMQNNSQTKNLPFQTKNLSSNCFFGGKNETEPKSTENLIFQAIKNLKAKIKLLDFQRGKEAAILLPDCHSNDNNNSEAHIATSIKHDSSENIVGDLEKNLASEALKMAEKRCVLLENQLSAMKRLFLRKIAKESCDDSINVPFKNIGERRVNNSANMSMALKEGLVEVASSVVDDSESLESLGLAEELLVERNLSSGADSDMFNIIKENSKEMRRKTNRLEEGCRWTYKDKIEKNVSNRSSKPLHIGRQKPNISTHPFILGGSSANSYNANVTNQRSLRNITQKDVYKARSKVDSSVGKNLAEASVNNLRSIYSDLCGEYEFLLNKKVKILDTLPLMRGKNLLQQKQFLNDICQTLPLKRLQIHKIKTMINNFNAYKTDYPNVHWEI